MNKLFQIACLPAFFAGSTICQAKVYLLNTKAKNRLLVASNSRQIPAATNLPPAVFALCADEHGRLAEPGQPWAKGCVVSDETVPTKRLIWGFTDGA